jgi:hypothetical protein
MTTDQAKRWGATRTTAMVVAVGVLLVVALLAVYRLADPFVGDHAVFFEYAKAQDRGAILYVDRWDPKGPFLSWFYLAAGRLAGFSEVGLRLFELGYQLTFAATLIVTLQGWLRNRWLEILAPIATIGVYYATTDIRQLTQSEFLIAFPLFVALWLAARPWGTARNRRIALFGAGVCAALVVGFKAPFAPFIVVGWLLSLWTARDPLTVRSVAVDRILPALAGGALVAVAVALWFAMQGALEELLWTVFVFPFSTSGATAPLGRLASSAAWYGVAAAPWLVLAAAAWVRWRGRREEWLTVQLVGWVVVAAVVILVQRFSWWDYHFTLFIVPIGLLAVRGADGLIVAVRDAWRPVVTVVLALVLFVTPGLVVLSRLATSGFAQITILTALDDQDRLRAHQRGISEKYDQILTEIAALEARGATPGPIYVVGDPLRIVLWDREQAIALSPWMWEYLEESQWRELPGQLAEGQPVYLYIEDSERRYVEAGSPETLAWIAANYDPIDIGETGMWYERRP